MGFFAVLKDPSDPTAGFGVRECHINLWVLKGLFGRRNFVWDVGLRIIPGDGPFQKFQIALPSGIFSDGLTDLHDKLLNDKVGQLIFGRPVNISGGNRIDYGEGELRLSHVPPSEA